MTETPKKRGRPAIFSDSVLRTFATEFLANGGDADRAAFTLWGAQGASRAQRALSRARSLGLLEPATVAGRVRRRLRERDAIAAAAVEQPEGGTNVVPDPDPALALAAEASIAEASPIPPLPAGRRGASSVSLPAAELLRRMEFIASADMKDFARFDFLPDRPPTFEVRRVLDPATGEYTEREIMTDPGATAPAAAAEEHNGVRGQWVASFDEQSIALALRAGYGPLIKELSFDTNGRIRLRLHDAADMMKTLARYRGLDKPVPTLTIEQLTLVASLTPEEQAQRALAAIARPLHRAGLEEAVDAEIVGRSSTAAAEVAK